MRDRIEAALTNLVGQPMWAAGLAGDILWLHFGDEHIAIDRKGMPRTVGTYAFHVSCSWRWEEAWGDLRADHHFSHKELSHLGAQRPVCSAVVAEDTGAICLTFADGSSLLVEADEGAEDVEYWRLFQPGREGPHLVVGARGLKE